MSSMKTQTQKQSFFLVFVSVLLLWSQVGAVRFDLESGKTKCLTEDIKKDAMTVGNYKIVNPNEGHPMPDSHKLSVRVLSAYGNQYHLAEHVSEGQFSFEPPEESAFSACFYADDHTPATTFTVEFTWKSGVAAKDWKRVVKKNSIEMMEVELKKMSDKIKSISEDMLDLRARGWELWQTSYDTNSSLFWLSFLSFGMCASVAGLQFWHLKSFFEKKKLI